MTASCSSTRPIADLVGPAVGAMRKRQGKFLAARERGSQGLHGHALIRSEVELPAEDAVALLAKDRGLSVCAIREVSDADRLCTLERWDMVCASCGRASEFERAGRTQADLLLMRDPAGFDPPCRQELADESIAGRLCGISRCPVCGRCAPSVLLR